MRVQVLGSGTSSGVPRIGPGPIGGWGLCDPNDPRNRRRRASIMVEAGETRIVVDTGPDFREQMLDAAVDRLDAILFTHAHADHVHGIDDVRQFFHLMKGPVRGYAHPAVLAILRDRFPYVFKGLGSLYPPVMTTHDLIEATMIGDVRVTPFLQIHGEGFSSGFHFENGGKRLAYSTDFNDLPDDSQALIAGVDVWIVDALRRKPGHPSHSCLDDTLSWIAHLQPRRAILTHMDNSMDYATLREELPAGIEPGYDRQCLDL